MSLSKFPRRVRLGPAIHTISLIESGLSVWTRNRSCTDKWRCSYIWGTKSDIFYCHTYLLQQHLAITTLLIFSSSSHNDSNTITNTSITNNNNINNNNTTCNHSKPLQINSHFFVSDLLLKVKITLKLWQFLRNYNNNKTRNDNKTNYLWVLRETYLQVRVHIRRQHKGNDGVIFQWWYFRVL